MLLEHPDAVLLAGGTDVGLWVTKQHRFLRMIVTLDGVSDMAAVEEIDGVLRIGAAAVYEDRWRHSRCIIRTLGFYYAGLGRGKSVIGEPSEATSATALRSEIRRRC